MNAIKYLCVGLGALLLSCTADNSLEVPVQDQVGNFIWKGLNLYYLWQPQVPDLSDRRFANQSALNDFVAQNPNPQALFDRLLYQKGVVDRFSVLTDDYTRLEAALGGTNSTTGMIFQLYEVQGNSSQWYGCVTRVLPQSVAQQQGVQRGMIFYAVNQTPLTRDNYVALLSGESYSVQWATLQPDQSLLPTGQSTSLSRTTVSENPVALTRIIDQGNQRVGYLCYNGFYGAFESQLNQCMAQFKAAGITHLVLDLRYNPGGQVSTAARLAQMITGGFTGQVFARLDWNAKVTAYRQSQGQTADVQPFEGELSDGSLVTSLGLTKLVVLTTKSTASASEMLINGLRPYLQVVQIGDVTRGKNAGSITMYDSPDFSANNRNPNHKYAMQPLVFQVANAQGFGDYATGLVPDIQLKENPAQMGVLGQIDEPLLQAALQYLQQHGRPKAQSSAIASPMADEAALRSDFSGLHYP